VGAGSHPDLFSLQRFWDAKNERLQAETSVAEARKAETFFGRTAAYGGWRVCVVDAADDLNENAANALLKTLEEPPPRSIFLLINHAPGAILRTIRSRCIRLDLQALSRPETVDAIRGTEAGRGLSPEEVTSLAALSEGSPGRALELADSMGAKAFERFLALRLPAEPSGAYELAEMLAARGQDDDFRLFSELLLSHVAGRARMEAEKGGMSAGAWAEAHGQIGHSLRVANGLNLDRRQLVLDLLKILGDAAKS
jgi:DNA polymerase-3 subunit delta'